VRCRPSQPIKFGSQSSIAKNGANIVEFVEYQSIFSSDGELFHFQCRKRFVGLERFNLGLPECEITEVQ